jgi:1-deoxy-D-xylulose-5-phosphate synthase
MKYLPKINSPEDIKSLTIEELTQLAEELRQEIVAVVSQTGGHLASNLGSVEMTIALHYVFDAPRDRILWDVSHQTYAHKLLTGRKDRIQSLRQYQGLAGYCKRDESEYDHFGAGHASTSISAALGFAAARDMAVHDHKVVAVIGDGAMTGGLAFEGMNNAGSLKKNLLVVLNDNTWSISKNVGSISKYLTGILIDEKFNKLRAEIWELTGRFKRRDKIRETIQRLENSVKSLLVPGMLFEKLGFRYFGPIDGHDLPLLIKTLKDIKNIAGPTMLHVGTVKGKGYAPAEGDAYKFHGIGKFDKVTGKTAPSGGSLPSYTKVFSECMLELAEKNDKVIAITAAMASGTGLEVFGEKFPDRFYDVGIAEGHAACFAAGTAAEGIRPYLVVYSTFMQRAYDQVIHDMAIQKLPVVICMDRAGLVGNDGPTHHGTFDLAYLSTVPNVTIAVPRDGNELRAMLHYTADSELPGITAIRYPRDAVPEPVREEIATIDWGSWEWLTEPGEIVVLAVGTMVASAVKAADKLARQGIPLSVVNARFVKPFDLAVLEDVRRRARLLVTVEEGSLRGGFGQAVAGHLLSHGFDGRFKSLGIPDRFISHGNREELLREAGLDVDSLVDALARFVAENRRSLTIKRADDGSFLQKLSLRLNGQGRKKDAGRRTSLTEADAE